MSHQYWPSSTDGTAMYGNMIVKLVSEQHQGPELIVRKMEVTQEGDYINYAVRMKRALGDRHLHCSH